MSLNPFEDEEGLAMTARTPSPASSPQSQRRRDPDAFTWDDVAKRLLDKKLVLTALELYTELCEDGKELRRLRDFFSNPANFETTNTLLDPRLPRSSSVQTFESLDDSHLSDEGNGVERLAVVEFELRKARETIASLREQLTAALRSGGSEREMLGVGESMDGGMSRSQSLDVSPPRPDELRAINFLVNEYLLLNACRLTAVTFSEEIPGQNFEDWDEVGLNRPRPGDLVTVFRAGAYAPSATPPSTADVACMTDPIPPPAASSQPPEDPSPSVQALEAEIQRLKAALKGEERGVSVQSAKCPDCRSSLSPPPDSTPTKLAQSHNSIPRKISPQLLEALQPYVNPLYGYQAHPLITEEWEVGEAVGGRTSSMTGDEAAAFHRSVSREAATSALRALLEGDPRCAALLFGQDKRDYSLPDLAFACELPADWRLHAEALDDLVWAASLPALETRYAPLLASEAKAKEARPRLLRLRALAWRLVQRAHVGPARHYLGLYLAALQSLAKLRVRNPSAAARIMDTFTASESASLGLDLLQDAPESGSREDEMEDAETHLALAISQRSLMDMGTTAKEVWDLQRNYSADLRDSQLLQVLGLGQRSVGILVDVPCSDAGTEAAVATLLGTVVETGWYGLCTRRGRVWLLRTHADPQIGSVSLATFGCDPMLQRGITWLTAQARAFLHSVCDGTTPKEMSKHRFDYPPMTGTLTLLNSLDVGSRLFILAHSQQGLLAANQDVVEAARLLISAKRIRADVLLKGTTATSSPMIASPSSPWFDLSKIHGGLYVPVHTQQPLTNALLTMVGSSLNDRRLVYDGLLRGQLSGRPEDDDEFSELHLLLYCTSSVHLRLNGNLMTVRFINRRFNRPFHLSLVSGTVGRASCYAQVFYAEGGLPTPVLRLLTADSEAPLSRSSPPSSLLLALTWQISPSQCTLSWVKDDRLTLSSLIDCHRYRLDDVPKGGGFLRIRATVPGLPYQMDRVLPYYFTPSTNNRLTSLDLTLQYASPKKDATDIPIEDSEINPILGIAFTDRVTSIHTKLSEYDSGKNRPMFLAGNCRTNSSSLIPGVVVQPNEDDKSLDIPTASSECASSDMVQELCAGGREEKDGGQGGGWWWVCEWLAHTSPVPPPASIPSMALPKNLISRQRPIDMCRSGALGWDDCQRRKWYMELDAPSVDRLTYRTWPPNASADLTDLVLRREQGRLKLEGTCCIRNITLDALGLASGLSARFTLTVDPYFNWFAPHRHWSFWQIAFVATVCILGLLLITGAIALLVRALRNVRSGPRHCRVPTQDLTPDTRRTPTTADYKPPPPPPPKTSQPPTSLQFFHSSV